MKVKPKAVEDHSVPRRGVKYNLVDQPEAWEIKRFGVNPKAVLSEDDRRRPMKGEWYLSGAVIEAYKAKNDMSEKYHVARLVS